MARATAEITLSSSQSRLDLLADVCKFGKLNGTEREELFSLFEKGGSGVRDVLYSWSRRQLKNYLNMKTGVVKKYTSYSKHKLIDRLFDTRLTKYDELRMPCPDEVQHVNEEVEKVTSKLGKSECRSRDTNLQCNMSIATEQQSQTGTICENSACRGKLGVGDVFCKRCSCCICHMFDDNKDPSLWIVCNNGLDSKNAGCNLSCHLECALKLQIAGVVQNKSVSLDGSFCCPSCRTVSDLLGCIKKQLSIAKEARRIDILCYRLYLAYRLLNRTTQYLKLFSIVREAAHKLEEEIGPLSEASAKLVRGIVSRLSTGAAVQKLLQCALEELEQCACASQTGLGLQGDKKGEHILHFTDVASTSITVSWHILRSVVSEEITAQKLWHRKAIEMDYLSAPTIQLSNHEQKARFCDLEAGTEYDFKLLAFARNIIVGQAEGVCCTLDNFHNRTSEILPKASAKSRVMPLGVQNIAKQSSISLSIDDLDTTFKVRNLGNSFHKRQLELSGTRQVPFGIRINPGRVLKCEQSESRTSDGLVPSDINCCSNAPTKPRSALILCDLGNKDHNFPSSRAQENTSTSNFDPDPSKLTTEMSIKHQPATNRSTLDPPIQSECVIPSLNNDEIAPFLTRSKDSSDVHLSDSLLTDDLPDDISTSKNQPGADCNPCDCEIENFTDSNSKKNDEFFQLVVHPLAEGDIELDPRSRKRTASEFHQSRTKSGKEDLKGEQPESRTSDGLVPSDINGCLNALTKPCSAGILCHQGNKDQSFPSCARAQKSTSTSIFDPDPSKLTTEMSMKHQPATNRSTLDPPIQSECVIHPLNDEIAPSPSRSKDSVHSAEAHPSESLPTDDLLADISTSKDPSGADCNPRDCEIVNTSDSNSKQNELFQLIVHPSVEGDIELYPRSRKRTAAEFHQSQNLTRWEALPHQQQAGPHLKADDFFEFWVKIVRWLECEGHLEAPFRMRFLSWLGLRATEREKSVITAFCNSMLNDPSSLAEQLMDTFQEIISRPTAKVVA